MKRSLAAIMASAMMLFALAGCSGGDSPSESTNQNNSPEGTGQAADPVTISVGVPTAPPALPDDYLELQPELPRWRALLEL